jgi:hypothetical protein
MSTDYCACQFFTQNLIQTGPVVNLLGTASLTSIQS